MAAPKWRQLADEFAERIRSGDLAPGSPLPPVRARTAADAGATTVQMAYRALEAEGLVRTDPDKGTVVRGRRTKIVRKPQDHYQWEKDRVLLPRAERSRTGVTERETGLLKNQLKFTARYAREGAPKDVARRFSVDVGTQMLHRRYRTSSRDAEVAISLIDSWLVYDVAARNPDLLDSAHEPWPGGTLHQLSTIGIEVGEISDAITARPPTGHETQKLDLDPGVAVLVLHKTSHDLDGRVVEFSEVVLPGDRYELLYTIPLTQWTAR
ncbi:GntR family transcriptional regulator [Streptomyces sp. NPDC053427]|uniref:GntR family transcriptional regulator n=1 Tax=Streptomyces sp. NPDC053427 TaxID=3365701 RepID=UPI0037CFE9BF